MPHSSYLFQAHCHVNHLPSKHINPLHNIYLQWLSLSILTFWLKEKTKQNKKYMKNNMVIFFFFNFLIWVLESVLVKYNLFTLQLILNINCAGTALPYYVNKIFRQNKNKKEKKKFKNHTTYSQLSSLAFVTINWQIISQYSPSTKPFTFSLSRQSK